MRAAVTIGPGELEIVDTDLTKRRPGEVVVRVQLSMLTSTDAAWFQAPRVDLLPMVQGGQAAGILDAGSQGSGSGRNVVVWPWMNCRRCRSCRSTSNEVCESRSRLGIDRPGTLSEIAIVPRANIVTVPGSVGPAEALAAVEYADAWRLLADAGTIGRQSRILVAGSGLLADQLVTLAEHMHASVARGVSIPGLTFTHIFAINAPIDGLLPALKPAGTVVVAGHGLPVSEVDLRYLTAAELTVKGSGLANTGTCGDLLTWMGETGFVPAVGDIVSLDEVAKGLADLGGSFKPLLVSIR